MRKQGSCLEKEIMQGTVPGARRRGRIISCVFCPLKYLLLNVYTKLGKVYQLTIARNLIAVRGGSVSFWRGRGIPPLRQKRAWNKHWSPHNRRQNENNTAANALTPVTQTWAGYTDNTGIQVCVAVILLQQNGQGHLHDLKDNGLLHAVA